MRYPEDFEAAWSAWPAEAKFRSSKKESYRRWARLSPDEQIDAFRGIALYVASVQAQRATFADLQYCGMQVYLNQARWESLIELEEQRQIAITQVKQRVIESQPVLALPQPETPKEERQAKLEAAHLALMRQNRGRIEPVVRECQELADNGKENQARKKWEALRKQMKYLPENWKGIEL